ncbi:DUF924 domain-containing protein [Candidatus Bandiella numerosa]|uniref:DUF924 family protein n=1 Tax=Candidatus Bandiella numerosa TaxID=2570586 RepID=UPI00249F274E|nr:DUF924 family protein [Candidatus Bandiella numerosa]WHA05546.1 DUF924 domain-containing protein [Candidatus Bandiella numerosa]
MQNYYKYKNDILSFWFSHKVKPFWYTKNENFDKELNNKFLDTYNQALSLPDSCKIDDIELILSFIILFDQFPRNMFRGEAKAFATDYKALKLAHHSIENKLDEQLTNKDHKQFLYIPFMHSENVDDQKISVNKFTNLDKESYKFAIMHEDLIARFGRFPGRNKALRRESTKEEIEFLKEFSHF